MSDEKDQQKSSEPVHRSQSISLRDRVRSQSTQASTWKGRGEIDVGSVAICGLTGVIPMAVLYQLMQLGHNNKDARVEPNPNSENGDLAGGNVEIPGLDLKISRLNCVGQNIAACSELLRSCPGIVLDGVLQGVS